MSKHRITPVDIIDVDALPEWNHSRRTVVQHTAPIVAFRRTSEPRTIDLTNMDDSDSDILILQSTPKPGGGTPGASSKGRGREIDFPSTIGPAIDKIRVCSFDKCFVHLVIFFSLLTETQPTYPKFIYLALSYTREKNETVKSIPRVT